MRLAMPLWDLVSQSLAVFRQLWGGWAHFPFACRVARAYTCPKPPMSFKVLFRSLVFLAILFVVLYAGINNTQSIEFSFPLVFQKNIREPAALVYFALFAIGVLGGTMLTAGGGGRRSGGSKDK